MKRYSLYLLLIALLFCACGTVSKAASPAPLVYNALVETGSYTDSLGNTWDYSFRIPSLGLNSDDARRINATLNANLQPVVEEAHSCMENGLSLMATGINYAVYQNGTVLSLVVWTDYDYNYFVYWTINIDTASGKELDRSTLLAHAGLTEESFLPLAQNTAGSFFDGVFGSVEDAFAQEQRATTISRENFGPELPLYLDGDGNLCMIVNIYSLAGPAYYPTPMPLE